MRRQGLGISRTPRITLNHYWGWQSPCLPLSCLCLGGWATDFCTIFIQALKGGVVPACCLVEASGGCTTFAGPKAPSLWFRQLLQVSHLGREVLLCCSCHFEIGSHAPNLLYSQSWTRTHWFFFYTSQVIELQARAPIPASNPHYIRTITRAREAGTLILLLKIYLLSTMHHPRGGETVRVVMAS